jgi:O-antigen/teichoic acid export membrane protein
MVSKNDGPAGISSRAQAAHSLAWNLLESGGSAVVALVTLLALSQLLSPFEIGLGAICVGILQVAVVPVETIFLEALVQRRDVADAHFNSAHVASVAVSVAAALVAVALSPLIGAMIDAPLAGPVVAAMAVGLLASGLNVAPVARMRRQFRFQALAICGFLSRLIAGIVAIVMALVGFGVWSLVAQQLLLVGLMTLFSSIANRRAAPHFSVSRAALADLIGFGVGYFANTMLTVMQPRLFLILIGVLHGPAGAGYMNLAFRIVEMPGGIASNAATRLIVPFFSGRSGEALRSGYIDAIHFTALITFPLFIGLAICGRDLILLLFGPQWLPAAPLVSLLALITLAALVRNYAFPLLSSQGAPHAYTPVLATEIVTLAVAAATFGKVSLGAAMAAWGLRHVFGWPVDVLTLWRKTGLTLFDQLRGVLSPLLAGTAMALILLAYRNSSLAPSGELLLLIHSVIIGGVSYALIIACIDRKVLVRLLSFVRLALR